MADPTNEERRRFAQMGWAMPDGSYYIRPDHPEDLGNAIKGVGRATATGTPRATDEAQRNAVRRHIMKRARALGRSDEIPDTWNSDGTLKQSALTDEFLAHFGVRGMRWGVRTSRQTLPSSHDAAISARLSERVRKSGGTKTLTNAELKQLVTRMNLEKQYSDLSKPQMSAGEKAVKEIATNAGKQMASQFIARNAPRAGALLVKTMTSRRTRTAMNREAARLIGEALGP
jgi:hypothetical protein